MHHTPLPPSPSSLHLRQCFQLSKLINFCLRKTTSYLVNDFVDFCTLQVWFSTMGDLAPALDRFAVDEPSPHFFRLVSPAHSLAPPSLVSLPLLPTRLQPWFVQCLSPSSRPSALLLAALPARSEAAKWCSTRLAPPPANRGRNKSPCHSRRLLVHLPAPSPRPFVPASPTLRLPSLPIPPPRQ